MHYLPQEILGLIDLNTLEISKDSFVEKELKDYFSDILYNVALKSRPKTRSQVEEGHVYLLFEHKSYPESFIHLQLLEYTIKIWRLFLKQKKTCKKNRRLPIVIPIVRWLPTKEISS